MNKYELMYEIIQESYDNGKITLEEADVLNDYAYDKFVMEAEEDHSLHMGQKRMNAFMLGKSTSELKNKKYKNEKSAKRADLMYQYKNSDKNLKKSIAIDGGSNSHTTYISKTSPKESDLKLLRYMKKHANSNDPKEIQKYKVAFNLFCNKWGINPNSSLAIDVSPNNTEYTRKTKDGNIEFGRDTRLRVSEWKDNKPRTKKDFKTDKKSSLISKVKDRKMPIPDGYELIHMTDKDGLTHLEPKSYSNRHIGKDSELGGQYHNSGRIYFSLHKKGTGFGKMYRNKYAYKLVDPVSSVYIDSESPVSRIYAHLDKIPVNPKNKMWVFVKTDKPLRVKPITIKED